MRRTRRLALSIAVVAATATGPVVATGFTSSASASLCEQVGIDSSPSGPCINWTLTPYFCDSGSDSVDGVIDVTHNLCVPD